MNQAKLFRRDKKQQQQQQIFIVTVHVTVKKCKTLFRIARRRTVKTYGIKNQQYIEEVELLFLLSAIFSLLVTKS